MRHLPFGRILIVFTVVVACSSLNHDPGPTIPLRVLLQQIRTVPQRASVLGYQREAFGPGWESKGRGCTTRDIALQQALGGVDKHQCPIRQGTGIDPYSGITIGVTTGADIELDHVFPLRAAWDMGAHNWSLNQRKNFANDPRNLIVASKKTNQDKSDSLPSEWMPPKQNAHCWYARRVAEVTVTWQLALTPHDVATMKNACIFRESIPLPLKWPVEPHRF